MVNNFEVKTQILRYKTEEYPIIKWSDRCTGGDRATKTPIKEEQRSCKGQTNWDSTCP